MKWRRARSVDELRTGTQRQAEHHVGQVDGLAPWARASLDERHVDQHHVAVADEQVGRLDVAVGQAGVPQLADERQAVVDDAVVDLGLAELGRVGDELGDEQVFPLGAELDEAVRPGRGQPGEVQLVQRVVLLLDQPPDGVERLLVLQPAIQQLPPELVPAVGAQVAAGVELGEQPAVRVAFDLDAQRRRTRRAGQTERFDLLDDQPELVLQRPTDRLAAGAADVQVRGPPSTVGDREGVVRGEQAESEQRDRHPDHDPDDHIGWRVHSEVHASDGHQRPALLPPTTSPPDASGPRAPARTGSPRA